MDPDNPAAADNSKRDEAADVVRDKLDSLYEQRHRQHQHSQVQQQAQADHFQRYHTEWQNYYQKYYEQYYVGHLHHVLKEKAEEQAKLEEAQKTPDEQREEAILNLRQKIVHTAKTKARSARKSRHFIPAMSALVVMLVVAFLQYNEVLFSNVQAFVSPGAIDPQNIVVDPTADVKVSPDPKLIIPKINVDVPVIYDVGYDHDSQMAAMQKGVAHFAIPGANSRPGQIGNTVFSGHSSNDLFDPGDYKFIFAQLDKMQPGDTIYVNYNSVRYTYTVTRKEVVKPTQVDKLTYKTDKPILTLITCTPLGTATNRLLVTAEQISPDPAKATAASAPTGSSGNTTMTGNAPTALERLFGAR